MNFGGWHPLLDAPALAPQAPGVLQARADALIAYPRGRSAMVLYAGSRPGETLHQYVASAPGVAALARAAAAGGRWVRFGASADPPLGCQRLLHRFRDRFGAVPAANGPDGGGDDQDHHQNANEEARSSDG